MKHLLSIILILCLLCSLSIPAYAVTPSFNIPNITIPDISDNIKIELPDNFWDNWFKDHPIKLPDDFEILILDTPVISNAKYVHKTPYYGMSKHLEISWNEIENAESYEVLITKADGTTLTYNVTTNLIYDKNAECPKIYIESKSTWTSASVKVRAVKGNTYSNWSESVKIGCDMLHSF